MKRKLVIIFVFLFTFIVLSANLVKADSTVTLTSTSDFDAGTKSNPADGNLGVETITDNPFVADGGFALANIGGDRFNTAKAAYTGSGTCPWTFKWCTDSVNLADQNSAQKVDISTTVAGQLYEQTVVLVLGGTAYGVVSGASYSGDFNFTVHSTHIDSGDQSVRLWFGVYNEQKIAHSADLTIDGVQWAHTYTTQSSIQPYTITDGVQTASGSAVTAARHDYYLRITRATNSIGFWYSTDGIAWTRQGNPTFTFTGSLYVALAVNANSGGRLVKWSLDDYYESATTIGANGYRISGNWKSAGQTATTDEILSVNVTFTSAAATKFITAFSLIDGTGKYVFVDNADVTSGTSKKYSPGNILISGSWKVQLNLSGDGANSITVQSVVISTGFVFVDRVTTTFTPLIILVVFLGIASFGLFALPVSRATHHVSEWFDIIFVIIGVAILLFVLAYFAIPLLSGGSP